MKRLSYEDLLFKVLQDRFCNCGTSDSYCQKIFNNADKYGMTADKISADINKLISQTDDQIHTLVVEQTKLKNYPGYSKMAKSVLIQYFDKYAGDYARSEISKII